MAGVGKGKGWDCGRVSMCEGGVRRGFHPSPHKPKSLPLLRCRTPASHAKCNDKL